MGRRINLSSVEFLAKTAPLVRLLSEPDLLTKIRKGATLRIFGRRPIIFKTHKGTYYLTDFRPQADFLCGFGVQNRLDNVTETL